MQKLIANILNIKLPEFASEMTEEFSTASAAHAHLETAHIRDFHATISLRAHDAFIEIESFDDDADIACTAVTVNKADEEGCELLNETHHAFNEAVGALTRFLYSEYEGAF